MSTTPDFIEYVCDQIAGVGALRHKKMFGDYMVYVRDKPALLVCDNTVFVKQLEALATEMKNASIGIPYPGAKPHYILDIDDAEFSKKIIRMLEPLLSLPKPRKKKL
ncbi:MAG: hypothetical protein LBO79_07935 [Zoogloeaceae bacterium]|jgi:TfoX/Sxy family transcriptional regulator of competence genes|nr:hypothetical protein [Zoogloeaceae bacterium]